MSLRFNTTNGLKSTLAYAIGIFAVVGAGVGLTGAVVINLLGSGSSIFSGIVFLIVIGVSLLIGPPIAGYIGIQIADRDGEAGALQSFAGAASGFLVMMVVVLLALFLGIALTAGGGAGTDGGTGGVGGGADPGTGGSSGGGFDFLEYLIPALVIAIPTGLTGGAATYLHGRSSFASGTTGGMGIAAGEAPNIPMKYIGAALLGIIVLIAGAFGVMALMSPPADNLEASDGNGYVLDSIVYGEGTVTNAGDVALTANLTMRLKIDGEYKDGFERTEEITVEPGEQIRENYYLGRVDYLTRNEREQIADGNFVIEYYIDGNLKYTS